MFRAHRMLAKYIKNTIKSCDNTIDVSSSKYCLICVTNEGVRSDKLTVVCVLRSTLPSLSNRCKLAFSPLSLCNSSYLVYNACVFPICLRVNINNLSKNAFVLYSIIYHK